MKQRASPFAFRIVSANWFFLLKKKTGETHDFSGILSYTFAIYSNGNGTTLPGLSSLTNCSRVAFTISFCIVGLFGSPAFAPIGTSGATPRGVPVCFTTGGNAAMMIVGIPAASIALCTSTAERWQVPQPAVKITASTPSSLNI